MRLSSCKMGTTYIDSQKFHTHGKWEASRVYGGAFRKCASHLVIDYVSQTSDLHVCDVSAGHGTARPIMSVIGRDQRYRDNGGSFRRSRLEWRFGHSDTSDRN